MTPRFPAKVPIALFARLPVVGQAKTRLAPIMGAERAADLAAAFLSDGLDTLRKATVLAPEVWFAGRRDDARALALVGDVPVRWQGQGDLGTRMSAALADMVDRSGCGLLVGSDLPSLPVAYLVTAAELLQSPHGSMAPAAEPQPDLVLGPAADGGYYLIGVRGTVPGVFSGVVWSSSRVLSTTLDAARDQDRRVALLPPWYDVDTAASLSLLRAHLDLDATIAPATRARLVSDA